jgi:hypothetical protein
MAGIGLLDRVHGKVRMVLMQQGVDIGLGSGRPVIHGSFLLAMIDGR